MSSLPGNPSESFKRRNPNLYGQLPQVPGKLKDLTPQKMASLVRKPRLRQERGPLMNKLESDWFNHLMHVGFNDGELGLLLKAHHLRAQSLKFKLANGVFYRPDITCWLAGKLTCFECKGPKEMRGMARGTLTVKVAAAQWPEVDWFYVYRVDGAWRWERVLA